MFKVIIAGGQDFTSYGLLRLKCDQLLANKTDIEIVSGKCPNGADKLGEQYAEERGYHVEPFPADWDKYGKAAGPIRNRAMAAYADALIAFWDERSPGTKNMIEEAQKQGLLVRVVNYKRTE